jgi:hypothetical protein
MNVDQWFLIKLIYEPSTGEGIVSDIEIINSSEEKTKNNIYAMTSFVTSDNNGISYLVIGNGEQVRHFSRNWHHALEMDENFKKLVLEYNGDLVNVTGFQSRSNPKVYLARGSNYFNSVLSRGEGVCLLADDSKPFKIKLIGSVDEMTDKIWNNLGDDKLAIVGREMNYDGGMVYTDIKKV